MYAFTSLVVPGDHRQMICPSSHPPPPQFSFLLFCLLFDCCVVVVLLRHHVVSSFPLLLLFDCCVVTCRHRHIILFVPSPELVASFSSHVVPNAFHALGPDPPPPPPTPPPPPLNNVVVSLRAVIGWLTRCVASPPLISLRPFSPSYSTTMMSAR